MPKIAVEHGAEAEPVSDQELRTLLRIHSKRCECRAARRATYRIQIRGALRFRYRADHHLCARCWRGLQHWSCQEVVR